MVHIDVDEAYAASAAARSCKNGRIHFLRLYIACHRLTSQWKHMARLTIFLAFLAKFFLTFGLFWVGVSLDFPSAKFGYTGFSLGFVGGFFGGFFGYFLGFVFWVFWVFFSGFFWGIFLGFLFWVFLSFFFLGCPGSSWGHFAYFWDFFGFFRGVFWGCFRGTTWGFFWGVSVGFWGVYGGVSGFFLKGKSLG